MKIQAILAAAASLLFACARAGPAPVHDGAVGDASSLDASGLGDGGAVDAQLPDDGAVDGALWDAQSPDAGDACTPQCAGKCPGAADGCSGFCATNDCSGCCDGVSCLAPDPSQCGSGGAACVDCAATYPDRTDSCLGGACSCGSLGAPCDAGEECQSATCHDPCGDPSVIPTLVHGAWNPLLTPRTATTAHGSDNIYAPDILQVNADLCLMWYGGQGSAGHDRIFLATSTDCLHWDHYPDDDDPQAVVDNGLSNHVNDPSVVRVGGTYYMYYTDAAVGIDDRIHLATSPDGVTWTKLGEVIGIGAAGTWDDFKVGRPSVVYQAPTFFLYYDGNDGASRHVGLATSTDGVAFVKHGSNPLVLNAGAVDVEVLDTTWVMVREAGDGVYASTSADGLFWCDQGRIVALSGAAWDAYGHVTPFLHAPTGTLEALYVGGASHNCWCHNRVGAMFPTGFVMPADPTTGCESCVGAYADCTAACRGGGYGVEGYCAHPGSTDPGQCCACVVLP